MITEETALRMATAAKLNPDDERFLMYIRGVSARKIADLAQVHPNAVHQSIKRYLKAVPELRALHESRRPQQTQTPSKEWISPLEKVLVFLSETGTLPHHGQGSEDERRLGRWLRRQRSFLAKGKLIPEQIRLLDHLRAWREPPYLRERRLHHARMLQAVSDFHSTTGRWPRFKSTDSHERTIGIWLHGRRQDANEGILGPSLRADLDLEIPGWRGRQAK